MFRTVSPSIIRSLRLYIRHQVYVIQLLWLFASGNDMEGKFLLVPASKQLQNLVACTIEGKTNIYASIYSRLASVI